MNAKGIQPGDRLVLKRDNAYGLPPETTLTVMDIYYKGSYRTPWILCSGVLPGSYRPSDFERRAAPRRWDDGRYPPEDWYRRDA